MEFIVWSCELFRFGASFELKVEESRGPVMGAGGASLGVDDLNSDVLSLRTTADAANDPSGAVL